MLSDREKFIYYATAIAKDQTLMSLRHDKRTVLLALIRDKYCPKVTNKEWHEVFHDCEDLRLDIAFHSVQSLLDGKDDNEIANMFSNFITKGKLE